ncbi:MAG: hypothetical protein JW953_07680 [Anaerolineae bacterium]|nr:hypothetical protein [Anaerolineae bacterium]
MNIVDVIRSLTVLVWLVAIGLLVLFVIRATRGQGGGFKGMIGLLGIILLAAIALTTVSAGLVFIQPEERGVVISAISPTGYRTQALEPGLRWIIPFAESVITYPISKQTYTMLHRPHHRNKALCGIIKGKGNRLCKCTKSGLTLNSIPERIKYTPLPVQMCRG